MEQIQMQSITSPEEEIDEAFLRTKEHVEALLGRNNLIECGELKFNKFDVESTKFMILKNRIEEDFLDNLKKCLFDEKGLNLPKPKFLLSVTGGAKKFTVSNEIIQAFKSALMKVAANTNALIVSGGLDVGVMTVVGDAVKEDLYGSNQKVLGIASWRRSKLQHRYSMEDIKNKYLNVLRRKRTDLKPEFFNREKENNLNPKHTCFIFVDNDHDGVLRGEMKFRAELENSMAKTLDIPLILIALEGGIGTLETIVHMIRNKRPVLLINKTGGCADLIQDLLKFIETQDSELIDDVIEGLINHEKYKPLVNTDEKKESTARYLKSISERDHEYINIFRITGDETKEDIEDQILDALTKVASTHNDHIYKMRLALSWDRLDKAKEALPLLNPNKDLVELHQLLKQALVENKPEFISLLMTKLSIRHFLTKGMLHDLYNNECRNSKRPHHEPLNAYLQKHNKINHNQNVSFKNIQDFLKLNFDTLDVSFLPNDDDVDEFNVMIPIWNIFLWCVLSNRISSAKTFWKLGSNQICNALMASKILRYFSTMSNTTEDKASFKMLAVEFEQLAISVLNVFEENTRDFVNDILVIRYLKFIRMDCLQLAVESKCEEFVAHPVIQNALDKIWIGKEECDWKSDVLSKYEKSLIYCQNEYNETTQYIFGNSYLSTKKAYPVWRLFCTPRTKFILHAISYILFLIFFTVTMLLKKPFSNQSSDNDYDENNTNTTNSSKIENLRRAFPIKEFLLLLWISALLIDEIRQMFFNNYARFSWKMKLKKYWQQEWNVFDVFGCLIFIIGFILVCSQKEIAYKWGRLMLSIDLAIWYIRALQLFFVIKRLGPKIQMIRQMVVELAYFFLIFAVFIAAFGVSLQSIINPYEKYNSSIISDVLDKAYWPIYGEIRLLDTLHDENCGKDPKKPCLDTLTFTSSYVILMIYMIVASVLLINLLIAMFTTIFDKIQNKSDIVWKNQRYMFIADYVDSPFLPPPLNLISYPLYCIDFVQRCRFQDENTIDEDDDVLREMERNCAKKVLSEYEEFVVEDYKAKEKNEEKAKSSSSVQRVVSQEDIQNALKRKHSEKGRYKSSHRKQEDINPYQYS